jgi:hypothetical protein
MMPWLKHHNSKYLSGVLYEKHVLNEKHCIAACLPCGVPVESRLWLQILLSSKISARSYSTLSRGVVIPLVVVCFVVL